MKWLDRFTNWFDTHVVKPLFDRDSITPPQLEVEIPDINPAGPIERKPIDFDRSDPERYYPLEPTYKEYSEAQLEDINSYVPGDLTGNQREWMLQMIYEDMRRGVEFGQLIDMFAMDNDKHHDFWEWYRSNYGKASA